MRKREREKKKQTDRQTETDRDRQTSRQTKRLEIRMKTVPVALLSVLSIFLKHPTYCRT